MLSSIYLQSIELYAEQFGGGCFKQFILSLHCVCVWEGGLAYKVNCHFVGNIFCLTINFVHGQRT